MRYFFAHLDEKHNLWEILTKFSYALFYHIFQKSNKPWVKFFCVWTKNTNWWENFEHV